MTPEPSLAAVVTEAPLYAVNLPLIPVVLVVLVVLAIALVVRRLT
jgi:hypothetical protein